MTCLTSEKERVEYREFSRKKEGISSIFHEPGIQFSQTGVIIKLSIEIDISFPLLENGICRWQTLFLCHKHSGQSV